MEAKGVNTIEKIMALLKKLLAKIFRKKTVLIADKEDYSIPPEVQEPIGIDDRI